jgi:hypothetical protein
MYRAQNLASISPWIEFSQFPFSRDGIFNLLRSPGIYSAYLTWRTSTTNRAVVPARQAGNRFFANTGSVRAQNLSSVGP